MNTEQFDEHTPGPWNVNDEVGLVIKHGDGAHDFVDMENGANARLMAAAPDLLAEVKRLREENESLKHRLDREERYVQLLHHEFHEEQKLMFTDEFNEKVSEIYEPQDGGEEENED